jgi:RNA polymerase sigma-70 factor, ECF subfamily
MLARRRHASTNNPRICVTRSGETIRSSARQSPSCSGPGRFETSTDEHDQIAQGFIAACAGGDVEGPMRLLDPAVVGDVDLGPGGPTRHPLRGTHFVSRSLLGFFGPSTATSCPCPSTGSRARWLSATANSPGILVFKVRAGLIVDIHAIADPGKLGFVANQLAAGQ